MATVKTSSANIVGGRAASVSSEPEWLTTLRSDAAAKYESFELPTPRSELWRFTDIKALDPNRYNLGDLANGVAEGSVSRSYLEQTAARASHVDGHLTNLEAPTQDGVIFVPLAEAATTKRDLVEGRLGKLLGADDLFKSWSLANFQGGMFLYVAPNTHVELPIESVTQITNSNQAFAPRTLVVVDEGASVVFNDVYTSAAIDKSLVAPVVEVFCGPRARIGLVTWQDLGRGVQYHAHVKATLAEHAQMNTLVVTLGADLSRTTKECVLEGEGAESYMYGICFPHDDQHFEHWTLQDHASPHATSDLLYKGALDGHSQSVYYGTIRVREGAVKTNAYQANRNLTLSSDARALTNPQLEIHNNDVRCTHGATVGRLNEDHLFYMQSRGIGRQEAERLVVFGFFNEVLDRVAWSGMQETLAEAIREKMLG